MTCKDFTSFILEYLEHDLDETTRATFEHHLLACQNCGHYLAQYLATISFGRCAFREPATAAAPLVPENVIASILAVSRIYVA